MFICTRETGPIAQR